LTPEPEINVFRLARPGIRKVLGELEAEIMEIVWEGPPGRGLTVRDVFEALYARRRIAYTTVMNTMARLAKKQLLRVEKEEQAYVYHPNFTQEQFVSRFVGRILEDLLVSFSGPTLERLGTFTDPEAVARAQRLLAEIARRRGTQDGR
jgi:predicted transcriptional regulator